MKKLLLPLLFLLNICAVRSQIIANFAKDTSDYPNLRNRINDQTFFLKFDTNNVDTYTRRLVLEYEIGDYTGCIRDGYEVIRLQPNSAYAYSNIGMCYCFQKEYEKALDALKIALKMAPDEAVNYLNLAYAEGQYDQYENAVLHLTKAIFIKPDYAKAYANRGFIKKKMGFDKESIEDYNKAIELNPGYEEVYFNRGFAKYSLGDYTGAISDYNKALELQPAFNCYDFYNARADAYEKLGDAKNAALDRDNATRLKK